MISTITSTQQFNAIHPVINVNATELFVYRLRNTKDLDTLIEEVSAVLDKKNITTIIQFSYINSTFIFIY